VLTENDVIIRVNPALTADELFAFYERNNICEVGFGKETAAKVLRHPHLVVAAYEGGELVGLARVTFDGLSAHVMEFSLDLRRQGGDPRYANGSLIEADNSGIGRRLGERLLNELEAMGASFISCHIVPKCEEPFYQSLGFRENEGHLVYYIIEDLKEIERIYILRSEDLSVWGSYTPILYKIKVVWDNPSSRWSPMSWVNNFIIESTLYHEIGHHVHRHTFGQDPDQEREADKYSDKIMANSNHLPFRIRRFLNWRSNNTFNATPR
jgi:hypothetical protein